MDNNFDWVPFYKELAAKLLPFRNDRQELIRRVRKIYETARIGLPTLEKGNKIVDICPFTFFGLFNKSSMKESNRVAIIRAVAELFEIQSPVPTSFSSIPVLNNQNATFYYFIGERGDRDIDDLWDLFRSALDYVKDPSDGNRRRVALFFDKTIQKKGNGNSKITMGLYWIAPDAFLNLDQRNTWYIYESGKIPESVVKTLPAIESKIPASIYFEIVDKLRAYLQGGESSLRDFMELSAEAWRYSEEVNQQQKMKKTVELKETKGAAVADQDVQTVRYWMYAPGEGASIWEECYEKGIMAIGWEEIGDLSVFGSKEEMKQKMKDTYDSSRPYTMAGHATWQFAKEMKPGDIVFAKKGKHAIVGRGIVTSDYYFDKERKSYNNVRKVKWIDKGEWRHQDNLVTKTLTDA